MRKFSALSGVILMFALVATSLPAQKPASSAAPPSEHDPWQPAELIAPAELVKELDGKKKPLVVCVGVQALYQSAHISGADFAGPAREADGIAKLKEWARDVPKDKEVVIYCGCCPFRECPNVRPAYEALRKAGFTNLRALHLRNNFFTDWMDKDYPIQSAEQLDP